MRKSSIKAAEPTAEEILMTATLMFPDDPNFSGAGAKELQQKMKRHCPKDRKVVAATWRNGITVVLGYPANQNLPNPEVLVTAYHEACVSRALADLVEKA